MNLGRWSLTMAYLLASLLAQGVHVHGSGSDRTVLEDKGNCNEARTHVADHDVADPGDAPIVCPSCQLRSQASFLEETPKPIPGLSVLVPIAASRPEPLPGLPLRTRCRAPPLA